MQVLGNRDVYSFDGASGIFPLAILQKAQNELLNWNDLGLGVMEMSHRSKEFLDMNDQANDDVRQALNVPNNYKIMFMQGGATLQYAAVPMNLLQDHDSADYLVTGFSSQFSYNEFKKYGNPHLVAPIQQNFCQLPPQEQWNLSNNSPYFYYTDNETANGLEFKQTPQGNQILVSDMTSSLGTKVIDINKYGALFASAQKNLGPAGVTIVIVREDLIGKHRSYTPNMFNWKSTIDTKSIFNTTPVFAVYMTGVYADFINKNGGVQYFEDLAERRSKLLYETIDSSHGFYSGNVINKNDRSRINAVFKINNNDGELEKQFIEQAAERGLVGLEGHQSVGGLRASMFNGMPLDGVQKLKDFMEEFYNKYQ